MVRVMKYLYDKVQKQIDEILNSQPKNELDMEILKRNLPRKMKLTRVDVSHILSELESDGVILRNGKKIRKRR